MNTEDCSLDSTRSGYRILMCWVLLIALDFCLMAFAFAQEIDAPAETAPVQITEVRIPGPDGVVSNAIRFEAIDVFIDSGDQPLAAWQLELSCHTKDVEIVGIEGGEHPAFKEPPFYDPRAMNNNRVILGAFSTDSDESIPGAAVEWHACICKSPDPANDFGTRSSPRPHRPTEGRYRANCRLRRHRGELSFVLNLKFQISNVLNNESSVFELASRRIVT